MDVDGNSLLASLLVSSIGLVLLLYGKRMGRPPHILTGIVLLVYPYFVSGALLMLGIAAVLVALLWVAIRWGH